VVPDVPAGPLPVRMQDGLSGLVLQLEPVAARVLRVGERRVTVRLDIGNAAYYTGEVVEEAIYQDTERQELRVGIRRGLGRGREASAQLTFAARNAGVLDPLLRFWHRAIVPYDPPGLEGVKNFENRVEVRTGQTSLRLESGVAALTNLTLGYRQELPPLDARTTLSARAALKLPLSGGRSYLDTGATDLALGLALERRLGAGLWLHGNLNVVRAGATRVGALAGGVRTYHGSALALEKRLSARDSFVVQAEETVFPFVRALASGSGGRRQMSFGFQRVSASGTRTHVSLAENVFPFRTTPYGPDVMLSFGLEKRF
jgi:hypothetical protein